MNEVTGEKVYRVWKTHHNLTNFLPNLIAPNSLKSNYSYNINMNRDDPKSQKEKTNMIDLALSPPTFMVERGGQ